MLRNEQGAVIDKNVTGRQSWIGKTRRGNWKNKEPDLQRAVALKVAPRWA